MYDGYSNVPTIQMGDHIIIQRQKYLKMCKLKNENTTAMLGKEKLDLRGLVGKPYAATFKMVTADFPSNETKKKIKKNSIQRLWSLHLCHDSDLRDLRAAVGIESSGKDNRNILDDGESQSLLPQDIEQLRDTYNDSTKIIELIVQNSKTFSCKTKFSQEKYLKKKEKKYFEYVQIHRPTLRLITEIYFRLDSEKIMMLRMDILSQILSYAGVCSAGTFCLYESGTQGLLPASFLNLFGTNTGSKLVHIYPGNTPQREATSALNLTENCIERYVSVNLFSVLRSFYQGTDDLQSKYSLQTGTNDEGHEPRKKKPKRDCRFEDITQKLQTTADASADISVAVNKTSQPKWESENLKACRLMREQFDSLVIAAREDPKNIINELLSFVKPSRPVVIYSQYKDILVDLYIDLKTDSRLTNLHLVSNWVRMYQILPNRTHPDININNNTGFILYGYTIEG